MPPTTNLHHHHHHPPPKRHPKLLSFFLKFIVLSLILALFLIFLGLAAIILLHVLFAGSFLHRRRHRHHRNTTTTPPPTAYSLQDLQTHLPSFQYSSNSLSTDCCSICLEGFKERDFCRSLPECDHVFHAKCVDSWLTKVPSCPVCRRRVRLEVDRPADRVENDDDECKFLWVIGVGERIGVNY